GTNSGHRGPHLSVFPLDPIRLLLAGHSCCARVRVVRALPKISGSPLVPLRGSGCLYGDQCSCDPAFLLSPYTPNVSAYEWNLDRFNPISTWCAEPFLYRACRNCCRFAPGAPDEMVARIGPCPAAPTRTLACLGTVGHFASRHAWPAPQLSDRFTHQCSP